MSAHGNPWDFLLEDNPNLLFAGLAPQFGSTRFQDFVRGRGREQFEFDFDRRLGQLALSGQAPNLNRQNFLRNFPFLSRFRDLSPLERGERSAPRTIFR